MRNRTSAIFSIIFTVILVIGAIYFFYERNFLVAFLLSIWVVSRLFGVTIKRVVRGLSEATSHFEIENKCNCELKLRLNIEEILKHQVIVTLFKKLQKAKVIDENINQNEWTKTLIQNYKKQYKKDKIWDEVRFNIKNNTLWKDGKIDFKDIVYHEIAIPYYYKKEQSEGTKQVKTGIDKIGGKMFLSGMTELGIVVRILIVNGIVKLQLGDFNKELSPNIVRKEGLAVYQQWITITSFPLFYFSYFHCIPEKYLNLSMRATDAYLDLFREDRTGNKKDFLRDWKKFAKEMRDYNYVCAVADQYVNDKGKWQKIVENFDQKRKEWLKRESMRGFLGDEEDESWYNGILHLDKHTMDYSNKYLSVSITNYNRLKDWREKYLYPDYYEEMP